MRFSTISLSALALAVATPVFAQTTPPDATPAQDNSPPSQAATAPSADDETAPPKPFTIIGGVTGVTDYRFRGVTQTDGDAAAQGTLNVNTAIGLYAGTFVSTIDGSGKTPALTGYGDVEIDLYGGFTRTFRGVGVDAGLLYYYYASADKGLNTDFFEPYASLSYTLGPVAAKVGAAYAWGGQSGLAGFDVKGGNDDNIYVYGEGSLGIPTTPLTLKAHLGYSNGALGSLNPAGSFDNDYYDWSVTAEAVGGPFKAGVSYVDTDISNDFRFARRLGRGSTVLGYIGFSF